MLSTALGALSGRLDSKFLTAYWLPAFVAVLGGFGILAVLVGAEQMDVWVHNLDSVEQSLAVVLIALAITMGAFFLCALSRPIAEVFAGVALPGGVAAWSTRGQLKLKNSTTQKLGAEPDRLAPTPTTLQTPWLTRAYPIDDDETKPTRFGNVLATAVEHPRLAYTMEGFLWWPRLTPLLPAAFQELLGGAQAPVMALLNLCIIIAALGLGGAAILGLAGHVTGAVVVFVSGLLGSRFCYLAAVSQAKELGILLRVGFDLYRHDILRQMDLEIPKELEEERVLWRRLTAEMLDLPYEALPDEVLPTRDETGTPRCGDDSGAELAQVTPAVLTSACTRRRRVATPARRVRSRLHAERPDR